MSILATSSQAYPSSFDRAAAVFDQRDVDLSKMIVIQNLFKLQAVKETTVQVKVEEATKQIDSIVRAAINPLESNINKLMFQVIRKRHVLDPDGIEELQNEWKSLSIQLGEVQAKFTNYQLSNGDAMRITAMRGQIQGIKANMKDITLFQKEPIFQLANLVMRKNEDPAEFEARKERINNYVQQLDPMLQIRLDYFVYLFSSDLTKGGDHWGKYHRFDDFSNFKKAFGSAVWDHVKHNMPQSWGFLGKGHEGVLYQKFYVEAKAKIHDRKEVLSFVKQDENKPAVRIYAEKEIMNRPIALCRAYFCEAGRDSFHKIFYGTSQPQPYEKGYTIRPTVPPKSALETVRDKLTIVCNQTDVDDNVKREYVRGCLDALPLEDRYAVEGHVYALSDDPCKGGDRWGYHHAYDNHEMLLAAVNRVVLSRVTS